MKLTRFTDYAMRTLMHLAAHRERLCSIAEVAQAYGISQNHLMKVVNDLVREGYIEGIRGRGGGIRLGMPASQINLGILVRHTEGGFDLVDCGSCIISPACRLTGILKDALAAFLAVLDRYTLADLMAKPEDFDAIFGIDRAAPAETSSSPH
ncbi:Rrf2 family transcriptional regulator [Novosphingobium sp. KN65.2]|uniref:Rrf2 family transcriptional regulator n=1 Tax=Novosphingobium sp. KN65.2 TaxID=1478134 RepID=UPI0006D5B3EB|nr:Rrf2 family transcriptional regulator [Novosphingobium sp. KN65.2]